MVMAQRLIESLAAAERNASRGINIETYGLAKRELERFCSDGLARLVREGFKGVILLGYETPIGSYGRGVPGGPLDFVNFSSVYTYELRDGKLFVYPQGGTKPTEVDPSQITNMPIWPLMGRNLSKLATEIEVALNSLTHSQN